MSSSNNRPWDSQAEDEDSYEEQIRQVVFTGEEEQGEGRINLNVEEAEPESTVLLENEEDKKALEKVMTSIKDTDIENEELQRMASQGPLGHDYSRQIDILSCSICYEYPFNLE